MTCIPSGTNPLLKNFWGKKKYFSNRSLTGDFVHCGIRSSNSRTPQLQGTVGISLKKAKGK